MATVAIPLMGTRDSMRIEFNIDVKAVLAVAAVAVVSVGSFFAGAHYQANRTHQGMYSFADVNVPIPNGITEESWCASHPSTNWVRQRESGSCDEHGDVWATVKPK